MSLCIRVLDIRAACSRRICHDGTQPQRLTAVVGARGACHTATSAASGRGRRRRTHGRRLCVLLTLCWPAAQPHAPAPTPDVPPFKLAQMLSQVTDKEGAQYQRMSWDALRKSINGLVNKVRARGLLQLESTVAWRRGAACTPVPPRTLTGSSCILADQREQPAAYFTGAVSRESGARAGPPGSERIEEPNGESPVQRRLCRFGSGGEH